MPILVGTGRTAAARDALKRITDPADRESADAALASALGEAGEAASEDEADPEEPCDPEDEAEQDELTRLCETAERLFAAGQTARATELAKRALSLAVANAPTITQHAGSTTTWTTNPSLPLVELARVSLYAGLLDALVSSASLLSSMSSRAEALSGIAAAVHEAGETSKSVDIWRKALKPARIDSRWRPWGCATTARGCSTTWMRAKRCGRLPRRFGKPKRGVLPRRTRISIDADHPSFDHPFVRAPGWREASRNNSPASRTTVAPVASSSALYRTRGAADRADRDQERCRTPRIGNQGERQDA